MFLPGIGQIVKLESFDQADNGWNGDQRYDKGRNEAQQSKLVFMEIQVDLQLVEKVFHFTRFG